jgi:hypothetical protein
VFDADFLITALKYHFIIHKQTKTAVTIGYFKTNLAIFSRSQDACPTHRDNADVRRQFLPYPVLIGGKEIYILVILCPNRRPLMFPVIENFDFETGFSVYLQGISQINGLENRIVGQSDSPVINDFGVFARFPADSFQRRNKLSRRTFVISQHTNPVINIRTDDGNGLYFLG